MSCCCADIKPPVKVACNTGWINEIVTFEFRLPAPKKTIYDLVIDLRYLAMVNKCLHK